jgi:uncharacterized phage infection (PIP) family protein YhgE
MRHVIDVAKAAMYLAATLLFGMLAAFAWHLDHAVQAQAAGVSATLVKTNQVLDDAHRVLLEAGLTAMEARKASAKESAYLDKWNDGISTTLGNTNRVLISLATTSDGIRDSQAAIAQQTVGTLKTAQSTIAGIQPVTAELTGTLENLKKTTADIDTLVPPLTELANNSASAMGHIDATTADVQQAVHSYFHPTWQKRVWSAISGAFVTTMKIFW